MTLAAFTQPPLGQSNLLCFLPCIRSLFVHETSQALNIFLANTIREYHGMGHVIIVHRAIALALHRGDYVYDTGLSLLNMTKDTTGLLHLCSVSLDKALFTVALGSEHL